MVALTFLCVGLGCFCSSEVLVVNTPPGISGGIPSVFSGGLLAFQGSEGWSF